MAGTIALTFCYLVIILQNNVKILESIIFILLITQCALIYCLSCYFIVDVVWWLILTSVLDIIINLIFCFRYKSVMVFIFCIITVFSLLYNIYSYLNVNYYIPTLSYLITDHYLQGLLLLLKIEGKYINITIKSLILGTMLI